MGLVEGLRRGEEGMGTGTALADLAYWNKDLVEKKVIPQLFEMDEHGLSALCRMWEAGFYPSTVPMMVDRLVDGQISLEHSTIFLSQLAGYSLTEADKKSVDPAALLVRLVQWTGCRDEEKVGISVFICDSWCRRLKIGVQPVPAASR